MARRNADRLAARIVQVQYGLMSSLDVKTGLPIGGQPDNEYVLRGMMWADNYWLFCDKRERLMCKVNDVIDELLDLAWSPSRNHCGGQVHINTWM